MRTSQPAVGMAYAVSGPGLCCGGEGGGGTVAAAHWNRCCAGLGPVRAATALLPSGRSARPLARCASAARGSRAGAVPAAGESRRTGRNTARHNALRGPTVTEWGQGKVEKAVLWGGQRPNGRPRASRSCCCSRPCVPAQGPTAVGASLRCHGAGRVTPACVCALPAEVKSSEEQYNRIVIPNEESVVVYYKIRQQLARLGKEIEDYIHKPKYCLPFLQPGRLVKVRGAAALPSLGGPPLPAPRRGGWSAAATSCPWSRAPLTEGRRQSGFPLGG